VSEQRRGLVFGVVAYSIWGLFPLYWPLLKPSTAEEILAHRVVWSLVVCIVAMAVIRGGARIRALLREPRRAAAVLGATVLIGVNWYVYIWAVNHGHVVEGALGYFVNPIVAVLLGVVVLGERLRSTQWIAVAIGALAVTVLTVDHGRPPWIALTLALTFGTYGLLKKVAAMPAAEGLTVETVVLLVPAGAYLWWLQSAGDLTFGAVGAGHALLLASTGVVTAVPLLCFAGAANRLPLSTVGLLQFLTPVLQFLLGITVFHETMSPARWAGFGLVWISLAVFTVEALRHQRRSMRAAVDALA
jgi:chloramphenicol-sensitive protein RarD